MNKGFGVQVRRHLAGSEPVVQPLAVVATDERDAELVAAAFIGGDAETIRQLTADEVMNYGLDLSVHGDAKALPILNF